MELVIIDRPRIVQSLEFHEGERGTIIHAPAGWGKTTAVRQWFATAGDAPGGGGAELALNRESSQATWRRLRRALTASGSLEEGVPAEPRAVAEALAHVTRPTFIRFDDFHHADPALAGELAELIEHTPRWINVVVVSRLRPPAPLMPLIGRGDIRVRTARDLAFQPKEVATFWAKMHETEPSRDIVDAIISRSDGQPALVSKHIHERQRT